MTKKLKEAREYEAERSKEITPEERPVYHLTPYVGWMNDPNGFSYYGGKYHMFYQYHPYDTNWGPMHWGHAVSEDLLKWEFLPVAMAPDKDYDKNGVFSGSAIELDDGRHLLMYTGVKETKIRGQRIPKVRQTQCVAFGDGMNYVKYAHNPVIDASMLPEGCSKIDFRDPKVVKTSEGELLCYVGSRPADGSGQILVYKSHDGINWEYRNILAMNENRVGLMWECPDVFNLDGYDVLFTSPQDVRCDQLEEGLSGNCGIAVLGHINDKTGELEDQEIHAVDYGIDFYAHQTVLAPDGRRLMLGWMQNWDCCGERQRNQTWFGQMTAPRELYIRDGRICQRPAREIEAYRGEKIVHDNIKIEDIQQELNGIRGRVMDLELEIAPKTEDTVFEMKFAVSADGKFWSSLRYDRADGTLTIDRSHSGTCRAVCHNRSCHVKEVDGVLKLRVLLDRFSAEVFAGQGEQVMTMAIYTDVLADGIRFSCKGKADLSVEGYPLSI